MRRRTTLLLLIPTILPLAVRAASSLLEPPPVARHKPPPAAEKVVPLYLRGDFNDWGVSLPMRRVEAGHWAIEVDLPAGRREFKLADADWADVDLGGGWTEAVTPGQWLSLNVKGSNLPLDVPSAGRYRFELKLGGVTTKSQVRVERLN